jgi:hypothetical protein
MTLRMVLNEGTLGLSMAMEDFIQQQTSGLVFHSFIRHHCKNSLHIIIALFLIVEYLSPIEAHCGIGTLLD